MTLRLTATRSRPILSVSIQKKSSVLLLVWIKTNTDSCDMICSQLTFITMFCAAHMPGEAWTGLNDINSENHFVYTDGSLVVRYRDEIFHIYCVWNYKTDVTYLHRDTTVMISLSVWLRTSSLGQQTNRTTGRIMKTVCTSEEWTTTSPENLMMTSAQSQRNLSAKKVSLSALICL